MEHRHNTRMEWSAVPDHIRAEVDRIAGSPIVSAVNASGGFSPGPAARCNTADGRQVFVKACGNDLNPFTPGMHRREAAILAEMPTTLPVPRLIGVVDDADWVALVIEHVDGRMPDVATATVTATDDVATVLRVVTELSDIGTPSPIAGLHPVGPTDREFQAVYAWQRVVTDGLSPRLDEWTRRHLDRLIETEIGWVDAIAGTTLLHGDLRTDNMLIGHRRTYVVDWPAAGVGAPWADLVGLLPALHVDGGPPPHDVFTQLPLGRRADPDAVNSYLAALAGYFTRQSLLPPPPGIAAVRGFQAAQGSATRTWLAARLGLD